MRIGTDRPDVSPLSPLAPAPRVEAPGATAVAGGGELQSAGLQAANAALDAMPEIDAAKVEALRDALARGEVRFDAARLAGLIARYHGSRA